MFFKDNKSYFLLKSGNFDESKNTCFPLVDTHKIYRKMQ